MPHPNTIKQVIVVRTDLKMPLGKACAQVAHASMAFLTDKLGLTQSSEYAEGKLTAMGGPFSVAEKEWIEGSFAKVCLVVRSEEELLEIHRKAQEARLTTYLITDEGRTVFQVPTHTCVAIGPDYAQNIDPITRELRLL